MGDPKLLSHYSGRGGVTALLSRLPTGLLNAHQLGVRSVPDLVSRWNRCVVYVTSCRRNRIWPLSTNHRNSFKQAVQARHPRPDCFIGECCHLANITEAKYIRSYSGSFYLLLSLSLRLSLSPKFGPRMKISQKSEIVFFVWAPQSLSPQFALSNYLRR